jgi:energy-coupling factor transporter ATP-binding protein EcfA2
MPLPLADYEPQRAAFAALLEDGCEARILFFRGESGTGKTTLLSSCRNVVTQSRGILYVNTDLKGTAITVAEILSRTSERLGIELLPTLRRVVSELTGIADIDVDDVKQSGIGNHINISLQVNDLHDRQQRQVTLTEALFADLRRLEQSVLFVFDTYQDAITEVQDWIRGPFLARVESASQVRVVIAGQQVPDQNSIDWGHCCDLHHLKGVPEPEHWIPVVRAMRIRVPGTDALSWLHPICKLLSGRPSDIMNFLAQQERDRA